MVREDGHVNRTMMDRSGFGGKASALEAAKPPTVQDFVGKTVWT
jgi:hypothetical protein